MKILVNGKGQGVPETGASLGGVVEEIRRRAGSERLVVSDFRLDGEFLDGAREAELAERPAADFESLEASLVKPAELVRRVLQGVGETLASLRKEAIEGAKQIRGGADPGGLVSRIAGGLSLMEETRQNGRRLMASLGPRSLLPAESRVRLEPLLEELLAALRNQDRVRLADSVEFELCPALGELEDEAREWVAALGGLEAQPSKP